MKQLFPVIALCVLLAMPLSAKEEAPRFDAETAYRMLQAGNGRFLASKRTFPRQDKARITEVSQKGQRPFAMVLSCSDSRVPVEHVFDAGIGDIFVIRLPGNVMTPEVMGSVEYALSHLKVPLLVVMGHSKCGAISTVAEGAEVSGNLQSIVKRIKPAVLKVRERKKELKGQQLVYECAIENVWLSIEDLFNESGEAKAGTGKGTFMVVGALYNLDSGKVTWLGSHPREKELIEKAGKSTKGTYY
ncbi:MAG: carbonic anhydrase [Candidatus Eremiobacteraeota bacterium]|nr:carbonic anhydrase [Candidatus Eremiobacteraeota bacterium]